MSSEVYERKRAQPFPPQRCCRGGLALRPPRLFHAASMVCSNSSALLRSWCQMCQDEVLRHKIMNGFPWKDSISMCVLWSYSSGISVWCFLCCTVISELLFSYTRDRKRAARFCTRFGLFGLWDVGQRTCRMHLSASPCCV